MKWDACEVCGVVWSLPLHALHMQPPPCRSNAQMASIVKVTRHCGNQAVRVTQSTEKEVQRKQMIEEFKAQKAAELEVHQILWPDQLRCSPPLPPSIAVAPCAAGLPFPPLLSLCL